MSELLSTVIDAYGGLDRWRKAKQISCTAAVGGKLWEIKGTPLGDTPIRATCQLHEQKTVVRPFGDPNYVMTFVPDRVVIETTGGDIVAERDNPRAAFDGHVTETPWDPLHLAYFNGYATWTYLSTPWILSESDVETWEIDPVVWHGEQWRGLRFRLPERFASHHKEMTFWVGPNGLIRRHDYEVDVWANSTAAHFLFDHVDVDGLKFPTRRSVYVRNPDGSPQMDFNTVWATFSDFVLE